MARSRWPARLAGPRAGVLILLALSVAGCGTVVQNAAGSASATGAPSPGSATPSSRQLCAQPGAVSRVIIARTGVLRYPVSMGRAGSVSSGHAGSSSAPPAPSPGRSGPVLLPRPVEIKVVTSAVRVRALARALCALPQAPHGRVNCPAFFLGFYRLTFTADGRTLAPVTAQVSGCRLVTGLGGPPRQALHPAFWNLLARIGGWPPTWPVHLPGGPVGPGPTLQPPGSGQPGCSPPAGRFPPPVVPAPVVTAPAGASHRACPGHYHPVVQSRH
jgi:hypothetical protein